MSSIRSITKLTFGLLLATVVTACGGTPRYMRRAEPAQPIQAVADQATIVFVRPSNFGGARAFYFADSEGKFLGALTGSQYFVTQVPPGKYGFVVHAENNDMMEAEVEAGRIYYVLASVRMGVWSARASISALKPSRDEWSKLPDWMSSMSQMQLDPKLVKDVNPAEVAAWVNAAKTVFAGYADEKRDVRLLAPADGLTSPVMPQ